MTLAEAKLAEVKLAETRRAAEMRAAEAKLDEMRRAVETKPASSRYVTCDECGKVTSVVTRLRDRGSYDWEIRVSFGGGDRIFVYPTDPGLSNGEWVRLQGGRLTRMNTRSVSAFKAG